MPRLAVILDQTEVFSQVHCEQNEVPYSVFLFHSFEGRLSFPFQEALVKYHQLLLPSFPASFVIQVQSQGCEYDHALFLIHVEEHLFLEAIGYCLAILASSHDDGFH